MVFWRRGPQLTFSEPARSATLSLDTLVEPSGSFCCSVSVRSACCTALRHARRETQAAARGAALPAGPPSPSWVAHRARRLRVHHRGADDAVGVAAREALEHVRLAHHVDLREPFDVHALATRLDVLADLQPARRLAVGCGRLQQVAHHLLVDLEVAAAHRELDAALIGDDALEDVPHGARQQPGLGVAVDRADDRVRLAGACLAVAEQRAIGSTSRHCLDDTPAASLVDLSLVG